jgi:predicted ArsR family transcriptional regulator
MQYQEIVEDGTVGKQAQKILNLLLYSRPLSLREIKERTEIEINAVSGRVNDLKNMGKVVECEKRKCSISGRLITPVSTPEYHITIERSH